MVDLLVQEIVGNFQDTTFATGGGHNSELPDATKTNDETKAQQTKKKTNNKQSKNKNNHNVFSFC